MNKLLFTVLILTFSLGLRAQEFKLDNWRSFTSYYQTNDAVKDSENNLWVATDGGIYIHNILTNEKYVFDNIYDLISINFNALEYDSENNVVYAGASDGVLEIIDSDREVTHITDIFNLSLANKSINSLKLSNDRLYIGGGFGLAVFDIENKVFIEDVKRFGNFNNNQVQDIEIIGNQIWVVTPDGVAFTEFGLTIANPAQWNNYPIDAETAGEVVEEFLEISSINDSVFVGSTNRVLKLEEDTFESIYQAEYTMELNGIEIVNNQLYVVELFGLYNYHTPEFIQTEEDAEPIRSAIFFDDNKSDFIVGFRDLGCKIFKGEERGFIHPNSPYSNEVSALHVDEQGNILASLLPFSIAKYNGNEWINYNYKINSELSSNAGNFIGLNSNSSHDIIASSFGGGLFLFDSENDNLAVDNYNNENSPLEWVADVGFVVLGETAVDRNNNIWMVNFGYNNTTGPVLHMLDNAGNFVSFSNRTTPTTRTYKYLTIDRQGTKWLGGDSELEGRGLYYLNDQNTPTDQSDDIFGVISTSNSVALPSNGITDLETDNTGAVFVGTDRGLASIVNPSAISFSSDPIIRAIEILGTESINDITIDALNYKWVATNDGVIVLNSDATDIIANINENNTPLPTSEILKIENNPRTGDIIFGTSQGIFVARSLSAQPLEAYDIETYPQPFDPIKDEMLTIEGLAPNTEIRILTMNGELVRKVITESSTALWDGEDESGNPVGNGIYLIVAASSSTESNSVAKIAVIRK